jgi:hypothetical protein
MPVTVHLTYQCKRSQALELSVLMDQGNLSNQGKEGQEFHRFRASGKRIQLVEQVDRKLTTNISG